MRKADNFNTVELGTTYEIPKYRVVDNIGIQQIEDSQSITFVRGDKRSALTEEEFTNLVTKLNYAAPYIGLPKFNITAQKFDEDSMCYSIALSTEAISSYIKEYNYCKDEINRYLNPQKRVDGVVHEQLLGVMIEDLQHKNSLISSRESSLAITNLQQALMWLEERSRLREKAGTLGTYNK